MSRSTGRAARNTSSQQGHPTPARQLLQQRRDHVSSGAAVRAARLPHRLVARPDIATGAIALTLAVRNTDTSAVVGGIALSVSPAAGGDECRPSGCSRQFPPGYSEHTETLSVSQPRCWNLDDPFLYRVTATVTYRFLRTHEQSVRCGFRDFRIVDGYFHLNGKRIFLKSTHTGNAMPIGQQAPVIPDLVRRDLIYAKAAGFNAVRFIAGVAYPNSSTSATRSA